MKDEMKTPNLVSLSQVLLFRVTHGGERERGRDATELVEITAIYTLGNKGINPVRHLPQARIRSTRNCIDKSSL
jgi:hypothetical protein